MAVEKKLSEKTLKKVYNRHYQLLGCFNYERQMSTGYAWTMMPAMRELYADDPVEMKKGVKRHLEFFNCATTPSPFIIGITCAMEEQNASAEPGEYDTSAITSVKTALMGPLAGIGDSFFWGTFRVIGAGIGAPLAVAGNFLGPLLYFLLNFIPSEIVRRLGFKIGYEGGSSFLTRISAEKAHRGRPYYGPYRHRSHDPVYGKGQLGRRFEYQRRRDRTAKHHGSGLPLPFASAADLWLLPAAQQKGLRHRHHDRTACLGRGRYRSAHSVIGETILFVERKA